ncbi:MAG TPA: hypothetical protein VFA33_10635 [Bryobacteraceae bacterium]|nr:hypothetical protein [Bryobacteraceae bacterium]
MTDAPVNWSDEEKALRELLRALRICLTWSRERAEQIACLDLDDYRGYYEDPEEDEHFALTAFDEDVDNAEEILTWRATVVAHLVGEALSDYAAAHSCLDDPWLAWRTESSEESGAAFVRALTEEEFYCARVAYHVHSGLRVERPSSIPTDGDLENIPGHLETDHGGTWRDWLDILGPPKDDAGLHPAIAAAHRDLTEGRSRPNDETAVRIAELADQVSAFQMPTIERLETIGAKIDALGAPDRFKAETYLKDVLGINVDSSLCVDARTVLLDAERRFRDPETLDWNCVISQLAKAFELQVKQLFVPSLAKYLKSRKVLVFPNGESRPEHRSDRPPEKMQPIIRRGEAVPKIMLGMISIALTSSRPELKEYGTSTGLDLARLKKLIDDLIRDRNRGTHETGMSFAEASRLREDWLGVKIHGGGIFGVFLPIAAKDCDRSP